MIKGRSNTSPVLVAPLVLIVVLGLALFATPATGQFREASVSAPLRPSDLHCNGDFHEAYNYLAEALSNSGHASKVYIAQSHAFALRTGLYQIDENGWHYEKPSMFKRILNKLARKPTFYRDIVFVISTDEITYSFNQEPDKPDAFGGNINELASWIGLGIPHPGGLPQYPGSLPTDSAYTVVLVYDFRRNSPNGYLRLRQPSETPTLWQHLIRSNILVELDSLQLTRCPQRD